MCYVSHCVTVHKYIPTYVSGMYHSTGMIHIYVINSYTLLGCAAASVKY